MAYNNNTIVVWYYRISFRIRCYISKYVTYHCVTFQNVTLYVLHIYNMQYATKKFLNKKKLFGVAHTTGRGGKRKPYKGLLVTKLTNLRFSASYKISLSSTNSELSVNNGTSKR
jgi:hypothetical protein